MRIILNITISSIATFKYIYTAIVNSIGHGSSGVTDIRSSSFDASNMYSLFRTLLKLRNNYENRKSRKK